MRHFKFYSDSPYELSIAQSLVKQDGVTHTFKSDNDRENMGYKVGEYDIYVNEAIYNNEEVFNLLKDYELVEIHKHYLDYLRDEKSERSYNELFQKYKVIEEERNKYADEKLKEQRALILKDTLDYYKKDIEYKINTEISSRYSVLLKRFHEEECPINEVCMLYRKYIDAEVKREFEDYVVKIFTSNVMKEILPYEEIRNKLIRQRNRILDILYHVDVLNVSHKNVYDDIKKFKNDLVDKFMKASGRERGQRDYLLYMKRAGNIADLIESKLWEYYTLSVCDFNKNKENI